MKKNIKKIGTSFEDDKETTLTGRGLYPWEQKVADERTGKRKFHGAFTGGFSAGFNNTCGSEFGFQPAQFVSSRSNRSTVKQQITDYMDEEDLGEFDLGKTLQIQNREREINHQQKQSVGEKLFDLMAGEQEPEAKRVCYGAEMPPNDDLFMKNCVDNPKLDNCGLGYNHEKLSISERFANEKNTKNDRKITKDQEKVKSLFKVSNDIYEDNDYSFHEPNIELMISKSAEIRPKRHLDGEIPGFSLSITIKPPDGFKLVEIPRDFNPHRFLMKFQSYRTFQPQKLNPEKREIMIEENKRREPLFAKTLSEADRDKIKSFKSFVKSQDLTERSSHINKQDLPFKDDVVKKERYYAYICNMEGLEVGGIAPARLMTASQIRLEKEEFAKYYEGWKNLQESKTSGIEIKKNVARWSDRTVEPWKPERLLCSLFNVPIPHVTVIEAKPVNTFREKVMPTVKSSEVKMKDETPLLFRDDKNYSDLFKSIFEDESEEENVETGSKLATREIKSKRNSYEGIDISESYE